MQLPDRKILKMASIMENIFLTLSFILFSSHNTYCLTLADVHHKIHAKGFDFKDIMRRHMGGTFLKGINDPKSRNGENPIHNVSVYPFYMDVFPVTVAQFWKFKEKKSMFKTSAETNGFSWVLDKFISEKNKRMWSTPADNGWLAVSYATWNRPEGPTTNPRERLDYPVVHVSYQDARAFCQFVGKRLPTEDEWEFAARGGIRGVQYPWGDKFEKKRMNIWQGTFPDKDHGYDGWVGLSPVDAFPPQNNYSMYDMLGNVWEWTSTRYYQRVIDRAIQDVKYVLKGGSYIDTQDGKANYVVRTANRMGQIPTYSAHNVGFRCAASAPQLTRQVVEQQWAAIRGNGSTTTASPPRKHRFEEMTLTQQRRGSKTVKDKKAKLKAFMEKDTKRASRGTIGQSFNAMRKEEL